MPKYIELGCTDTVHESDIIGAVMPPKKKEAEPPNEEVSEDGQ